MSRRGPEGEVTGWEGLLERIVLVSSDQHHYALSAAFTALTW